MSTIAIVVIVVGAVILFALVARLLARPRMDAKRRDRARPIRSRADQRRIRAEKSREHATEHRARARREALEAEERGHRADEELEQVGREYREAQRLDPDRQ